MIAPTDLLHTSPAPYFETYQAICQATKIKIHFKIILFVIKLHVFRRDAAEPSGEGISPAHRLGIKR
jgi:hypothetical protein